MRYNWAMYPGFINDDRVSSLIEYVESKYDLTQGLTIGGGKANEKRKSNVAWIGSKEGDSYLRPMIWDFAQTINAESFGFDIRFIPPIQYTVYSSDIGGKYDWHYDTFFAATPRMYDRKLTFILQLSDSSEYEGGDLILDKDFLQNKIDKAELRRKGTAFIFPTFIRHKVTPVTAGTRRCIVAWIEGPKFR
jgi:PKHD-type hydroxylase